MVEKGTLFEIFKGVLRLKGSILKPSGKDSVTVSGISNIACGSELLPDSSPSCPLHCSFGNIFMSSSMYPKGAISSVLYMLRLNEHLLRRRHGQQDALHLMRKSKITRSICQCASRSLHFCAAELQTGVKTRSLTELPVQD